MSIYKSLPATPKKAKDFKRHIFAACFAFAFMFTLSFLFTSHPSDTSATLSGFSAGNIINDYTMSNYNSMSEADIQAWLTSKNSCNNRDYSLYQRKSAQYNWKGYYWHWNDGHFVCLSEERFGNYANEIGSGETAAHIIWQAAQDYHINPQVLLVLLQKETGLITDTIPNTWDYNRATGYGCPDTAPCDTQYYGFKNQVRHAAELFHNVLIGEWSCGNYPAYQTVFVKYHPSYPDGSWVYIENRATGALYRYTPYQPNAAALAAGYGTGDYLSSYGNRNFYNYFTDWFGSTQHTPFKAITPRIMTVKQSTLRIRISDSSLTDEWVYADESYTFDRQLDILRDGKKVTCRSDATHLDSCVLLDRLEEFAPDYSEANHGMAIAKQFTCRVSLVRDRADCSVSLNNGDHINYLTTAVINGKRYYISDSSSMTGYLVDRFDTTTQIVPADFKIPRYMKSVTKAQGIPLDGSATCPTYAVGTVQYYTRKVNIDSQTYYAASSPAVDGIAWCAVPANSVADLITPINDSSYMEKFAPFRFPRILEADIPTQSYDLDSKLSVCKEFPKGTQIYFSSKIDIGALTFYRSEEDGDNACIIPSSALKEVN